MFFFSPFVIDVNPDVFESTTNSKLFQLPYYLSPSFLQFVFCLWIHPAFIFRNHKITNLCWVVNSSLKKHLTFTNIYLKHFLTRIKSIWPGACLIGKWSGVWLAGRLDGWLVLGVVFIIELQLSSSIFILYTIQTHTTSMYAKQVINDVSPD